LLHCNPLYIGVNFTVFSSSKFRVQFVFRRCGINGHNGHFFAQFVDTMDAITRCGYMRP